MSIIIEPASQRLATRLQGFSRCSTLLRVSLSFLAIFVGASLYLQINLGWPLRLRATIPSAKIRDGSGGDFMVSTSSYGRHYRLPLHNKAAILEDGLPLEAKAVSSGHVRRIGRNAYFFGERSIWFATSDGSDPRTNGKSYEILIPTQIGIYWGKVAPLMIVCGVLALCLSTVFSSIVKPVSAWLLRRSESVFTGALLLVMAAPMIVTFLPNSWKSPGTGLPVLSNDWVQNRTISGIESGRDKIAPTIKTLLNGKLMNYISGNFDATFPFREVLVRATNEVRLRILGELPGASPVVAGLDHNIFGADYLQEYYLVRPDPGRIRALAPRLKELQDICKSRRIAFAVVITPSKASIYPEDAPPVWTRFYDPRPRAYDLLVEALGRNSVDFVDGHQITLRAKAPGMSPAPVFPKGGIHWSQHAAQLTAEALLEKLREQNANLRPMAPYTVKKYVDPIGQDADIYSLANLMSPPRYACSAVEFHPHKRDDFGSSLVFVGGSFTTSLGELLSASKCFSETVQFFYYRLRKVEFANGDRRNPTGSVDIGAEILSADCLVVELNEAAIAGQQHVDALLEDCFRYLQSEPAERGRFRYEGMIQASWNQAILFDAEHASNCSMPHAEGLALSPNGGSALAQRKVILRLQHPNTSRPVRLTLKAGGADPAARVAVSVNSNQVGSLEVLGSEVREWSVDIPNDLLRDDGRCVLTISTPEMNALNEAGHFYVSSLVLNEAGN